MTTSPQIITFLNKISAGLSLNFALDYTSWIRAKNSGRWKFGFSDLIGAHER